jgi:hypothetical protein
MSKKETFNWAGITDNGDGSYTAKSKIEKKRLLKSLHTQGYAVRSKRLSDGSWMVTPIGAIHQRPRRRAVGKGYRPRTKYPAPYRPGPYPGRQYGPPPRPMRYYGPPPSPGYAAPGITLPHVKISTPKLSKAAQQQIDIGKQKREEAKRQKIYGPFTTKQERAAESLKIEEEMRQRSAGQPSTRIPTQEEREKAVHDQEILDRQMHQRQMRQDARERQTPTPVYSQASTSQNVKMDNKPIDSGALAAARQEAVQNPE